MTKKPVLFEYFKSTAEILLANYNRSAGQGASDNLGRNREIFVHDFLNKVLPPRLKVHPGGEILDSLNNSTGQQDILIARDDAPCLDFGGANTYLAEGVFSVIEVKSNLTREKLQEAGRNFTKVASMTVGNTAIISTSNALSRPLRIVFAYTGASFETLKDEIIKSNTSDLFDLICILDKGVLIKKGLLLNWGENPELFLTINGGAAALGFLYYYLTTYSATFIANSTNLEPYFSPFTNWST